MRPILLTIGLFVSFYVHSQVIYSDQFYWSTDLSLTGEPCASGGGQYEYTFGDEFCSIQIPMIANSGCSGGIGAFIFILNDASACGLQTNVHFLVSDDCAGCWQPGQLVYSLPIGYEFGPSTNWNTIGLYYLYHRDLDGIGVSHQTYGFAGFRIVDFGQTYYGYFEIEVDDIDPSQPILTLGRCFVNTTPDEPITVGEFETYSLSGAIFHDVDEDGVRDIDEPVLPQAVLSNPLVIDGTSIAPLQDEQGFTVGGIVDDTVQISFDYDESMYELTTDNSSVELIVPEGGFSFDSLFFGVIPIGDTESVSLDFLSSGTLRCNTDVQLEVSLLNESIASQGQLILTADTTLNILSTSLPIDSIVGELIYMSYELSTFQQLIVEIELEPASEQLLGQSLQYSLAAVSSSSGFLDSEDLEVFVQCSYDPNEKNESLGWREEGFILAGDRLRYRLDFQNTGNAEAFEVTLQDSLPAELDISTLQYLHSSHDCVFTLEDSGYLEFYFEDIFLPDSASDPMGSQGHVIFDIETLDDLVPGTTIENTVAIVFDSNPAIITNTTQNTIFHCDGLQGLSIEEVLCLGDTASISAQSPNITDYEWLVNGVEESMTSDLQVTFSEDQLSADILLLASNPLCEQVVTEATYSIPMPIIPVVTSTDLELVGEVENAISYQWYLDGEPILGANGPSHEPGPEEGLYVLEVVDANGCLLSSEGYFWMVSSAGKLKDQLFTIVPNPASDGFFLRPSLRTGAYLIRIHDAQGRLVKAINLLQGDQWVDMAVEAEGTYIIQVIDECGVSNSLTWLKVESR